MAGNAKRYIKHVECISCDEFAHAGVFQSMLSKLDHHSTEKGWDSHPTHLIVSDGTGECRRVKFSKITCNKNEFMDSFSDEHLCAVKLLWSDGNWEYGLKSGRSVERTHGNRKLKPLFVKVGMLNGNGKPTGLPYYTGEVMVPAWILDLIPRYNERIRDALLNNDRSIENDFVTFKDWLCVHDVLCSNYASKRVEWKEVPSGKSQSPKMPLSVEFGPVNYHKTYSFNNQMDDIDISSITIKEDENHSWKYILCKEEFGDICTMLNIKSINVFINRYVKSIYCDNTSLVKEYKVYPMSDVLMVVREFWDSGSGTKLEQEIWNSLDETCKGNV